MQKKTETVKNGYDIDKLARCVAKHETVSCTKGSAKYNNCHGIMQWDKKGNRSFRRYKTKEDSYEHFKAIWQKSYGGLPNLAKAKKYSGNDRANIWLANVNKCYSE